MWALVGGIPTVWQVEWQAINSELKNWEKKIEELKWNVATLTLYKIVYGATGTKKYNNNNNCK